MNELERLLTERFGMLNTTKILPERYYIREASNTQPLPVVVDKGTGNEFAVHISCAQIKPQ